MRGKQIRHRLAIGDIVLFETKIRVSGEFGQTGFLQLGVVIRIKIVKRHSGAAVGQQTPGDVKADEASCAGDQNRLHRAARPAQPGSEARAACAPKEAQSSAIAPTIW